MGTIGFPNFGFSLKSSKQNLPAPHSVVAATKTDSDSEENVRVLRRRSAITYGVSLVSSAILGFPKEGLCAVKQGLLAGRIPGLSEPNEQDWTRNRLHPGLLHGLGIETSRREQVMRFKAGEDSLRRSDLGYTIIRPGPLMEEARGQRALVFYQGNRISQGIICADVADICVKTLHDSTARNKSFDVCYEYVAEPGKELYEPVRGLHASTYILYPK